MADGGQLSARVLGSIDDLPRSAWQALFRDAMYDFDYFRACELAVPDEFAFCAAAAFSAGRLVAGTPVLRVTFRLETAVEGLLKTALHGLGAVWPRLVNVPILGAGSPHAERLPLVFAPEMDAGARRDALRRLIEAMDRHARRTGADLLVIKDVQEEDAAWCHDLLMDEGFSRTASLPIAVLALPFASPEDYVASLSKSMRWTLRNNLKKTGALRLELRDTIAGIEDQITALAWSTRQNAKATYDVFDRLSPDYFRTIMEKLPDRARVLLVWLGGELIGFAFLIVHERGLEFQHAGMRYPVAREHSVYFAIWMYLVALCVERRIPKLIAGQTAAFTKVRLGCKLERDWIYLRHRRPLVNRLFQAVVPRIGFDKLDPDLVKLGPAAPYVDHGPGRG